MNLVSSAPCRRTALACLSALGLASSASSQVTVPGDFSTPQLAVDASPSGSTVIVAGGTWGPLSIDKELTLIGEPRATFEAGVGPNFSYFGMDPAIYLDGPGSGTVKLVNIQTSTNFDGFRGFAVSRVTSGIVGANFDAVHVYDSLIFGVEWDRSTLTGSALGASAIELDLNQGLTPMLLVQDSFLRGSRSSNDFSEGGGLSSTGAGIRSDAEVVVINSTIIGGTYDDAIAFFPLVNCPAAPGGFAVQAPSLFEYSSSLQAGAPGSFSDVAGTTCSAAPGPALSVGSHLNSGSILTASTEARLGQDLTLLWNFPNSTDSGLLFISAQFIAPLSAGFGTLFLDPAQVLQVLPLNSSAGVTQLPIPNDPSLIGFEAGFQAFIFGGAGLGNPLGTVVLP